jgi:hypothetical protein
MRTILKGADREDLTRRGFLAGAVTLGSALAAGGGLSMEPVEAGQRPAPATPDSPVSPEGRRLAEAFDVRLKAAEHARGLGAGAAQANGEEDSLPGRIACYSKGLPHNRTGEVDAKAYEVYLKALRSGKPEDFERIPLGGFVKLANPQSALAFELIGPDSSQVQCPPAPGFASPEQAAEIVELYWQALARDVPFADYAASPVAGEAAAELSGLPGFRGPKREGRVTPDTLFRGATPGDLAGPYLSQFLWKPIPFLPIRIEQKIRTAVPGIDYLTDFPGWLAVQNGALAGVNRFDASPRYIRNGRDLGEYVHRDFTYQSCLSAFLIALKAGVQPDGGNPYKHSRTQSAFATFGQPFVLSLLAQVTQSGLKACWYQKWITHRRLRPEEYAGRVETQLGGPARYPVQAFCPLPDGLGDSTALQAVRKRYGTALLPQAYPEGCPTHPSYPAGHAVIAGACVTVIKACLDESYVLPEPVVASADGLSLLPWKGPELTVGGELDKLAANIIGGRNFAGLHWRSDALEGLRLGEEVAIRILEEMSLTGNELFAGWSLKRFDGRRITVG